MPFSPRLPARLLAQIHAFAVNTKAALGRTGSQEPGSFLSKLAEKAGELRVHAIDLKDKLLEKVPPEKRNWVVMGALGFCFVLLLVVASMLLFGGSDKRKDPNAISDSPRHYGDSAIIPHDELFLPDEPDFIPGVILEREQRTTWTADDVAPWWHDPLENGEEPWRSRIEKVVDDILESVP